ncbi:NADH dehydrogenase [ubiquinone] iron-sulfur protein 2, mitochondrial, partial [Elysia marginata]
MEFFKITISFQKCATHELSAAAITCPDPLLANFNNYTVNMSSSSTAQCTASGGYIHVCSNTDTVEVEYSVCPTIVFYSTGGLLNCVHYANASTVYYVNLLNLDSSVDNTVNYHYTCLVIDYTVSPVFMTQVPRKCVSDQTPTSLPSSGGATFELYAN